jgi:predicted phage terminase large subunit-like protein
MKEKYAGRGDHIFIAYPVKDEEGHSNFNYEHPDHYTDEMIQDLEDRLDPATFSALYMQQGIEKEGLAFTEDNLQFYNGTLPDGEPDDIFFWADVAWGGGDSFSMPIIYAYGDTWYCPDVIFDQGDKTITKPRVVAKILHHKIMNGGFEANNGGDEYCDDITRLLKEKKYSCHLVSKKAPNTIRKETRIEQHQDAIRHIYFLDRQHREKEYDRFMRELQSFSFTGKNLHDDAPDSLAGVVEYKRGRTVLSTVEIRNRLF